MNRYSKWSIFVIIGLVVVSLMGLVIIQNNWLKSAIIVNEQKFNDRVFNSLYQISESYGTQLQTELDLINDNPDDTYTRSRFENNFKSLVDEKFGKVNISSDYEFGFYNVNKEIIAGQQVQVDAENCNSFPFLCNYELAIYFPNKQAALLAELGKTLAPTILFILILMGSFAYIIVQFSRQKKISEIKNDFINNLTHEFKTPLASISLASHVLRDKGTNLPEEKEKEYLEVINHESRRLETHIDKVLQIAQIDSGNFNLEKQWINVHDIIHKVTESLEPIILEKKGEIKLNLNASKPMVYADEMHITNIIYNLIDNAIKYTQEDPQVILTTTQKDGGLEIVVKDNGIGIKKEAQEVIFDKFYRERSGNVHNTKGFGLGLSYVKRIIDAHKGRISISSELNTGSEFQLFIPS